MRIPIWLDDIRDNTSAAASLLFAGTAVSGSGIVEKTINKDMFSFTTNGGNIALKADVVPGASLDLKLELRDSAGNLVTSADTSALGETISAILSVGKYYLAVPSHGAYGDVGQYKITGTVP